jgi:site-specific recombinase XerC
MRSFFRWARTSRLVLADPTAGLSARRPRGYHPRTLTVTEQRRLFRRWTTDPDIHPHEALTGLLALLHATPSKDLRNLKVTDIDATARTIRLGHRPHPVPLDPATWHALQRCLNGIVNLVGLCGAWKDRVAARGGGGLVWWRPLRRRIRGSASRWRSSVTVCGCIIGSR